MPIDAISGRLWSEGSSFSASASTKKFGSHAAALNGAAAIPLTHGATSDLNFGTGDWCIKTWVRFTNFTNTTATIIISGHTSWVDTARVLRWDSGSGGTLWYAINVGGATLTGARSTTVFATNTWYYVELSKTSGTIRMFVNGTLESTVADSNSHNLNGNSATYIGSNAIDVAGGSLTGFLDDFIIEKGSGHSGHTSNYTAPTSAHTAGAQTVSLLSFDVPTDSTNTSPHRYWRVNVLATDGGAYVSCLELEMHTSLGGAQVASGGTAMASSTGFGWTAPMAFDGSLTEPNGWHSGSTTMPQWLGYDFGSGNAKAIREIKWASRAFQAQEPTDFEVQFSDDASAWSILWAVTGASFAAGGENKTFSIPTTSAARPVVFVCT